jgi:peptide-methionine (S)-S-oxide reductase
MQVATLAGGCFWCLEAVFAAVEGVISVQSGYAGGSVPDPSYELVCTGQTGHAEAVQIKYDPQLINYHDLLEIFFFVHDPTTLNRQGNDVGTQYRSVIFYHNEEQKIAAQEGIDFLEKSGVYRNIVTEVIKLEQFYPAEEYHFRYFEKHPRQPYCSLVIKPKLDKFRQKFKGKLKS